MAPLTTANVGIGALDLSVGTVFNLLLSSLIHR